jgi:hypothetical protein
MESSLESITKLFRQSCLKIKDDNTGLCLFNQTIVAPVVVWLRNAEITLKLSMNMLGVIFKTKLNWHMATAVIKAKQSLNALKLTRKFFLTKELLQIVNSNFYLILPAWVIIRNKY